MRGLRRTLLLGVTFLLCVAGHAHACSCFGPGAVCTIEMGKSTIFRGTVLEATLIPDIHTIKRPDGTAMQVFGNGTIKVRFSVAETFSGEPRIEQIVSTAQQGSACGFPFQVGREYVVFTYAREAELWTSHCSRTALLQQGIDDPAITWMRAYKTAPHGSELFGWVHPPRDGGIQTVLATIQLAGPENRNVTTDADGKYHLQNLKPGEYVVTAHVPDGFATGPPAKVTLPDKGCADMGWAVTYEGRIRGRVVDVDGRPVADLRMELQLTGGTRMNDFHRATTELNGSYVFEHLSPGDYLVAARSPGFLVEEDASTIFYPHAVQPSEARVIPLGEAASVDGIDLVLARLRPTPSARVKVVMPDGSPAPAGLYLYAFPNRSSGNEPTRTGFTDSSGTALLQLNLGREYAITVALDRQHVGCGFATLTFSEDRKTGIVNMDHPENCTK